MFLPVALFHFSTAEVLLTWLTLAVVTLGVHYTRNYYLTKAATFLYDSVEGNKKTAKLQ
jgi:uncharacterized membrane protein